jgi:hypothetical protein
MSRAPINKFFDYFYETLSMNPDYNNRECYELTELWYKWKYGRNRYKSYDIFRVRFHYYLKRITQNNDI